MTAVVILLSPAFLLFCFIIYFNKLQLELYNSFPRKFDRGKVYEMKLNIKMLYKKGNLHNRNGVIFFCNVVFA